MKQVWLDRLLEARRGKRPLALVTDLESGRQSLVGPDSNDGDLALDGAALGPVRDALKHDRSGVLEHDERRLFVHVYNPPLRLAIVGAVHIAQVLAPMATLAGYQVTVVDPRGAFATANRFPDITLDEDWPDDAMHKLKPDARTAVVTLTHDPKLDDPALEVALKSDAFYIGSLGSQKTHRARLNRMKKLGFSDSDLERIQGPLGLKLGGRSPAEIAIAALAQITQTLHGREAS